MFAQPGNAVRGDHQAGRVERVEAGEDQHQPQRRDVQVVGLELSRQAVLGVLAHPRSEVEQDAERERARDAVHDGRRDRVVEAEAQRQPAARAPAPGRVEDPHDRAEQAREHEVGGDPRALDDRAGHDRGRRPREQQEGQEEDEVDVVREVRPERVAPRDAGLALDRREVARVRADRQAGLRAAVDPPAEVVERRRHDGDREDVLHRRRHQVLAARDAGLVGHEAGVDQPHQDDGEEVELLADDERVLRGPLGRCGVIQALDLGQHEAHERPPPRSGPHGAIGSPSTRHCGSSPCGRGRTMDPRATLRALPVWTGSHSRH